VLDAANNGRKPGGKINYRMENEIVPPRAGL